MDTKTHVIFRRKPWLQLLQCSLTWVGVALGGNVRHRYAQEGAKELLWVVFSHGPARGDLLLFFFICWLLLAAHVTWLRFRKVCGHGYKTYTAMVHPHKCLFFNKVCLIRLLMCEPETTGSLSFLFCCTCFISAPFSWCYITVVLPRFPEKR